MAILKKALAKKKVKSRLSYADKIKYLRHFTVVPRKKLTRAFKSQITRDYNKLIKLKNVPFIKETKKSILNKYDKSGLIVTPKGIFYPTAGKRITLRKDGLISTVVKSRTTYFIPFERSDIIEFLKGPEEYIAHLKILYKDIFKRHKKDRFFIRLIFPNAIGKQDFSLEELDYYIEHMPDVIDTRNNKTVMTGADKRKAIAKRMTGIVLMFYKKPKRSKRDKIRKTKNRGRRS